MHEVPAITASDIQRMLRAEFSTKARTAYVVWLLCTATFAAALLSLWLTEPVLALRTHIAFAILVAVNLSWAGFCSWALTRKKVLYARQGVIAGRLAVCWSGVFVAFALVAGWTSGRQGAGLMASASGLLFLGASALMLRRATVRRQQLLELRRTLES